MAVEAVHSSSFHMEQAYTLDSLVLAMLLVLLWVQVAGPPVVDVTNILIKAVGIAGVSLTSTNHEM